MSRVALRKIAIFSLIPAIAAYLVVRYQDGSAQAAGIASGFSALVAISAAVYVLQPRLNYWLLRRETRRLHDTYVAWLTLTVSNVRDLLAGSRGTGGARTDALCTIHLVSTSLPNVPPNIISAHFAARADVMERIATFRRVAEEVIGTRDKALEDPRLVYQMNLVRALGLLLRGAWEELGGHGYVTELWENNLEDWVVCSQRQYRALKRPLGPSAAENQLLNLLDRLLSNEYSATAVRPLKQGDLVRIRTSETEWIDTVKLTSDPELVGRRDSGLPVWRLEVVDAAGVEARLTRDRMAFEPAPRE